MIMKKLILLFFLAAPFFALADTGVTEDTVKALLKDMGEPESFEFSDEAVQSLVQIKGSKKEGTAFVARLDHKYYCLVSPRVLAENAGLTIKDVKGEKLQPEGMECSSDGRVVRLRLKERPVESAGVGSPDPGATLRLLTLNMAKKEILTYPIVAARKGEGRIDLKDFLNAQYLGYPVFDSNSKPCGFLENRVQKNIGDLNSSTNRHVMSNVSFVTNVEDAKWETAGKNFLPESARLMKKEDTLYEAAFLCWQWMNVTVFHEVSTNGMVKSEPLLLWAKVHNARVEKLGEAKDKYMSGGKGAASAVKEISETIKKDALDLRSAVKKALEGDDQAITQPALINRVKALQENEKTLVKGIEYMADHMAAQLKPKK